MKIWPLILSLILFFREIPGQNENKNFEFGSTLVTANATRDLDVYAPRQHFVWKTQTEWLNALFFRYTRGKTGFRVVIGYSENHSSHTPPSGAQDDVTWEENYRDFKIGGGVQFSPINKIKGFYCYGDLLYRHKESKGHVDGGFSGLNDDYTAIRNGMDCFFGLGYRIRIFKNFFVTPETGFHLYDGMVNYSSKSLRSGKLTEYSFGEIAPPALVAKLHVTVAF